MPETHQGGCLCGAIRYEYTGEPIAAYNCHCRACQQFTGSGYVSAILLPLPAFKLTAGKPVYYTMQSDSGDAINRGFCGVCASPICATFARMPDVVSIIAANLDDPSHHQPQVDFYTSHAQPWDCMNPDLPKFPAMPPKE